jgi:hypothetical protein
MPELRKMVLLHVKYRVSLILDQYLIRGKKKLRKVMQSYFEKGLSRNIDYNIRESGNYRVMCR